MMLTSDTSLPSYEIPLEDGRLALFLPVRAPNGNPVGIAMILADRKSVGEDTLERINAAPVRAIMQRLAVLLKPTEAHVGWGTQPIPILEFDDPEDPLSEPVAAVPAPPIVRAAPAVLVTPVAVAAAPVISAEEIDDILEFELAPEAQPAAAARAAAHPYAANRQEQGVALDFEAALAPAADPLDMLNLDFEEPQAATGPANPHKPLYRRSGGQHRDRGEAVGRDSRSREIPDFAGCAAGLSPPWLLATPVSPPY